jgi:hypothetical protein
VNVIDMPDIIILVANDMVPKSMLPKPSICHPMVTPIGPGEFLFE